MKVVQLGHLAIGWLAELDSDPIADLIGWLPTCQRSPDLLITLGETSQVHRPEPSWGPPLFRHNRVELFFRSGITTVFDEQSILTLNAEASRLDIFLHPKSAEDLPGFSRVTLLLTLAAALRFHGLYHVHAGGAVLDGTSVLIVGDSGMGKSSTTLALIAAGADCLSDDVLFVAKSDQTCFGLPARLRLSPEIYAAYPRLADSPVHRSPEGKLLVDFRDIMEGGFAAAAVAPHVLLLPQIHAKGPTQVLPTAKADALGRLLVSSAWVTSEHLPLRDEHMSALAKLVDQASCFDLVLGPDAKANWRPVAEAVRAVI